MKRSKSPATDVRYLTSSAFNSYISVQNTNAGQAADGTPNVPTVVASNVHASISPWRSKEVDKQQTRDALSSYKIVIRYPKTWNIDTGCQILVRGQVHNIDSFYDPDGQRVELHIYTFVTNDAVSN
jgi:SPP1 family predicted phage head-tail adaptor